MTDKLLTRFLFAAVFVTLASSALASTTWYVNGVSGSDSNNCMSSQTACKTIGHAISLATPSDTIMVAAATYTESLTIGISLNVIGAGASGTIIKGFRPVTISSAARVTLSNLTLTGGNTYDGDGGGIYNVGTLTVNNSTISGNTANSYCGRYPCVIYGGGIFNKGTLTVNNSTISGNTANSVGCRDIMTICTAWGGGIANYGGTTKINNSTINGNTAIAHCVGGKCFSHGGGIFNSGMLTVSSSTISGNGRGGGINNSGTSTLQNSILSNSTGNCFGPVTSHGYNLSSDGSCAFSNSGDRDNTDPMLGTLGYYGGPTPTIPLLTGSPAIDAGNPSGCTDGMGNLLRTDQRGMLRPDTEDTSGCDIGAYERQSD